MDNSERLKRLKKRFQEFDASFESYEAWVSVNFKIDVAMVVQVNFLTLNNRGSLCNEARTGIPGHNTNFFSDDAHIVR